MKATDLVPHPKNWRRHPQAQSAALKGLLDEIGYAGALIARELPDGKLMLIDGHLRAETTPDMKVPVLVLDVTEEEAEKILLTMDPLSAMASTDSAAVSELLEKVQSENNGVEDLLENLRLDADMLALIEGQEGGGSSGSKGPGSKPEGVPIRVVLYSRDLHLFEAAMRATGRMSRGEALAEICSRYLAGQDEAE